MATQINASNLNHSGQGSYTILGNGQFDPITGNRLSNVQRAKTALNSARIKREAAEQRQTLNHSHSPFDPLSGSIPINISNMGMGVGIDLGKAPSNIEKAKIALNRASNQKFYTMPADALDPLKFHVEIKPGDLIQPTQMDDFMKWAEKASLWEIKTKDWTHPNPRLLGDWAI